MWRREFLAALGCAGGVVRGLRAANDLSPLAIQSGDVTPGRAMVWARSAVPSKMNVQWSTGKNRKTHFVRGQALTAATDFTGRVELSGLPAGQMIRYEVHLEAENGKAAVAPLSGQFRTTPGAGSDVRFLWSGDMVGQGWGINPGDGGVRIFDTMRKLEPHFFLHSGDTIYADGPVPVEVSREGRKIWSNIVTPEKSKVAESLDEFRGCYRYNLLDENVRRFCAEVPQIWQWDDHELANNWSPSKDLSNDDRYKEKRIPVLVDRARQAFLEYAPMRLSGQRIYRRIPYGPLLDVFMLDMRSYRGPNTYNRQTETSPETAFLGSRQLDWLLKDLRSSKAVWKVIAADMPLGLLVKDGKDAQGRDVFENSANGNGPALGRELEIASLLSGIKRAGVRNTVWFTADVHYTAAHYFDPAKARYTDFLPFWEFVSGPLNAGTSPAGVLDDTFGPTVIFEKSSPRGRFGLGPPDGLQFFGDVRIEAKTKAMEVVLRDMAGTALFKKTLAPEPV
ncbi:MAG: alkaline phosphatase D family protein [Candidatus Solibacter usitatus]|nr:alkaline phosphatase D family protein [Candidatus Solibacter usitatus]